jgi:hypothetical protein
VLCFWGGGSILYFVSLQSLIIKPDEKKHLGVYDTNWNSVLRCMFEVIQPYTNLVQLLVCEHSNATSDFIKCGEIIDQLHDYKLLK